MGVDGAATLPCPLPVPPPHLQPQRQASTLPYRQPPYRTLPHTTLQRIPCTAHRTRTAPVPHTPVLAHVDVVHQRQVDAKEPPAVGQVHRKVRLLLQTIRGSGGGKQGSETAAAAAGGRREDSARCQQEERRPSRGQHSVPPLPLHTHTTPCIPAAPPHAPCTPRTAPAASASRRSTPCAGCGAGSSRAHRSSRGCPAPQTGWGRRRSAGPLPWHRTCVEGG